jgi:hypothetical protein
MRVAVEVLWKIDELTRTDLQNLRDGYFACLLIFTGIVIVGIALEGPEVLHDTFNLLRNSSRKKEPSAWEKWLASVGWLLIVLGLAGEFVAEELVSKADGLIKTFDDIVLTDTQHETSKAIEHAAEANRKAELERLARLQLQKELQVRRLTTRQKQTLAGALGNHPQPIFIGFCMLDPDCIDFANDIGDSFKQAHWTPTFGARTASPYGIVVGFMKGSDPILADKWTGKVRQALGTVGLSSEQWWFDPSDKTLVGGFEKNVLYLIIGPRPAPKAMP